VIADTYGEHELRAALERALDEYLKAAPEEKEAAIRRFAVILDRFAALVMADRGFYERLLPLWQNSSEQKATVPGPAAPPGRKDNDLP
jgi:hypothetical protein